MFPATLHIRLRRPTRAALVTPRPARDRTSAPVPGLRLAGLTFLLAAGLSQRAGAQASGTMQVTAHVVPATASWAAVQEATAAIVALGSAPARTPQVRRQELVRTSAEVQGPADRPRLVVTVQHPHN